MDLGQYGVWIGSRWTEDGQAGEAAALAERLGFGTLWLGGSPKLPALRPLLEASERIVFATGILNVWQNDPAEVADQYAELDSEFPGRIMLGIGIGHPEQTTEYASPLATMGHFLDGLDNAGTPVPREGRCLAALRPRMLDLCAQRAAGAHPYFVPVAHSRVARGRLGAGPLLAPEMSCVLDTDTTSARAKARRWGSMYLGLQNYTNNLLTLDFTAEDIADGGSDRLIDAVIPNGSAEQIAAVARAHRDAGADHVALQPVGVKGIPHAEWEALAGALLG